MYLTLGYISIGRGQWPLDWQSGVTGGSSIQETGPEAVLRLQEVPNSSGGGELFRGTAEADTVGSQTSESGGTMWVPSWLRNTGPAPRSPSGARGVHGSSPNPVHMYN